VKIRYAVQTALVIQPRLQILFKLTLAYILILQM